VSRGARRIGASMLLAGVVGAGCGGGTTPTAVTAPATHPSTPATTLASTGPSVDEIIHADRVVVGGVSVAVPRQNLYRHVSPVVDAGQQILIAAAGFLPHRLFANPNVPVVWTNLTDQPQQVTFDHLPVTSPVIPPGGSWSWTSVNSQSISYHSVRGAAAVLAITTAI